MNFLRRFLRIKSTKTHPMLWLILMVGLLAGLDTGTARAELRVVPPDAPFSGANLTQWAESWWRWYYRLPGSIHPRTDRTGKNAAQGQEAPVWFLADSFIPSVVRHVQIPAGHALLIPIVEQSFVATLPNDPQDAAGILKFLPPFEPTSLLLTLDNVVYTNLTAHLLQSDLFDRVTVGVGHPSGTQAGVFGPALGQGLFILLEAPAPGRHRIRYTARSQPQAAINEVNYEIEVLPTPPTVAITLAGTQASVSWPTNATEYELESGPTPNATQWLPLLSAPGTDGERFIQTLAATDPAQYFQLRRHAELGLRLAESFVSILPNTSSLVGNGEGTGFASDWRSGGFNASQSANYRVESDSLTYPGLLTRAGRVHTGRSTVLTGANRIFSKSIPNLPEDGPVYFLSVLARAEGVLNVGVFNGFFGFYLSGTTDLFVGKGGDGVSKDWIVEERGGLFQAGTGRTIQLNQTDLLVVKFDFRSPRRAFVYINPLLTGTEPLIPDLVYTAIPANFTRVTLYSSGAHSLDEFRIGTSFAGVTPAGL